MNAKDCDASLKNPKQRTRKGSEFPSVVNIGTVRLGVLWRSIQKRVSVEHASSTLGNRQKDNFQKGDFIPTVIRLHGVEFETWRQYLTVLLVLAEHVIAVSSQLRAYWLHNPASRLVETIMNQKDRRPNPSDVSSSAMISSTDYTSKVWFGRPEVILSIGSDTETFWMGVRRPQALRCKYLSERWKQTWYKGMLGWKVVNTKGSEALKTVCMHQQTPQSRFPGQ